MKKIAVALFLTTFFLLRPFVMQYYGLMYPDDDFDYFAHASSLAFGQFPSYKNEFLMDIPVSPNRAIGAAILAAPFVFVFSCMDRINGSDIVEKRTGQNIQTSWSAFGFIFASIFYFSFSCILLFWSARSVVGPSFAVWATVLMVICQGMPLYAYRRPVFCHVPELFLQSVFVYLFVANELADGQLIKKWWSFAFLGIGAGLMVLTRYNNILFAIMWPLLFLGRDLGPNKNWGIVIRKILCMGCPAALLILIFKWWPENYNHYTIYQGELKVFLIHASWQEYVGRLGHVFFAPDWGLIFTAPFLLLGAWGLTMLDVPWKKKYLLATLPVLLNLYIIYDFGYQGSYYGYRYLIGSAFPLFVIPLAFLSKWLDGRIGAWWKWGAAFLAIFPLMSMWCWEGNALVSTHIIPVSFGRSDWSNATYQIAVWKSVLDLKSFGKIIYLGGIQYVHYLFNAAGTIFGVKVNPPFDMKTLVQTMMIYALPFVLAWVLRDKGPTKSAARH